MAGNARLLAAVVAALCLAAGLAGSASGYAQSGQTLLVEHWNGASWKVAPAVAPRGFSELRAVTAISPTNLWAVGSYVKRTRHKELGTFPLAEHYNGSSWSPVVLPTPNKNVTPELNAVSASSAKDVWAVGVIGPHDHTLIEHFNGQSWKVVPSLQAGGTKLMGVVALTRRNAWAVGALAVKVKNSRPLIEHWNGSSWRRVPSPNPRGPEDELLAITALSAHDIWAVGDYEVRHHPSPLILHWNGQRWKQVQSPPEPGALWGLTAVGAKDAWAVEAGAKRHFAEHWNGHAWRLVAVPSLSPAYANFFTAVSASSPTNVWAAGEVGYEPTAEPLAEHWNGHAWTITRSVRSPHSFAVLNGIAAVSASDVWAVGVTDTPTR